MLLALYATEAGSRGRYTVLPGARVLAIAHNARRFTSLRLR